MDCSLTIPNFKIKKEIQDEVDKKKEIKVFNYEENNAWRKCEVKTEEIKDEDAFLKESCKTKYNFCNKSAVKITESNLSEITKQNGQNKSLRNSMKTKPPGHSEASSSSSLISKNFRNTPCTASTPDSFTAHKRELKSEKKEINTDYLISTQIKNNKIKACDFKHSLKMHRNSNRIVFSADEANSLVAEFVADMPKYSDLPKEPGSKYVDQFLEVMPNLMSSDEEEEFKETPAKKIKKTFGYNGKPLPDSCIIENYDWLLKDKEWAKKNRQPALKTPVAERLSSCAEAGEEDTKEFVAELEMLHQVSASATVHQVSTATTKFYLLPDEVPVNNLILRVELRKLDNQ